MALKEERLFAGCSVVERIKVICGIHEMWSRDAKQPHTLENTHLLNTKGTKDGREAFRMPDIHEALNSASDIRRRTSRMRERLLCVVLPISF
jgi:hypothetical protein